MQSRMSRSSSICTVSASIFAPAAPGDFSATRAKKAAWLLAFYRFAPVRQYFPKCGESEFKKVDMWDLRELVGANHIRSAEFTGAPAQTIKNHCFIRTTCAPVRFALHRRTGAKQEIPLLATHLGALGR